MRRQGNLLTIIWSGFLILGLFVGLCAQERTPANPLTDTQVPLSKQARTMPVSKSKITLKLTFDGEPFEVTQYEGATIRIERNGSTFGLAAYLEGDSVKIKAFKMFTIKNGEEIIGEGVTELADSEVSVRLSKIINDDIGATIELLTVKKQEQTKENTDPNSPRSQSYPMFGDTCCVTCNGTRVCGCGVTTSCGSCCVDVCGCG